MWFTDSSIGCAASASLIDCFFLFSNSPISNSRRKTFWLCHARIGMLMYQAALWPHMIFARLLGHDTFLIPLLLSSRERIEYQVRCALLECSVGLWASITTLRLSHGSVGVWNDTFRSVKSGWIQSNFVILLLRSNKLLGTAFGAPRYQIWAEAHTWARCWPPLII